MGEFEALAERFVYSHNENKYDAKDSDGRVGHTLHS